MLLKSALAILFVIASQPFLYAAEPAETIDVMYSLEGYGNITISKPNTHKNMTIFVISRAEDAKPAGEFITLDEGLAAKKVLVTEKKVAEVDTLQVENISDKPLFIQTGDVVKGGQQDRTFVCSVILPPRSGKVDVPSLCVEASRWSGETQFQSASNQLSSKDLRLAKQQEQQEEVWNGVRVFKEEAKKQMEEYRKGYGVTGEVTSKTSSLNEELDNKIMKELISEYEKAFAGISNTFPRATGIAFVLNGEINTIEIYQTNGLFKKLILKLIKTYSAEAATQPAKGKIKELAREDIRNFISQMEKGDKQKKTIQDNQIMKLENEEGFSSELKDQDNQIIHREYIKK